MATDIRKATLSLGIDSRGARNGANEFEDSTRKVTSSAKSAADSIDRLIHRLTALGAAYLGLRGIRDAVREFADFELKLAEIATMLDEQTMHHLPGYSRQIRSLSIEMGESTTTLSKGLYDIISACIPADQAMELLAVSARAAKAGISDTGTAADAITTVLNSYGLSVEHAAKISSDMFETIFHGKVIFPELAHSIGHVSSMAAAAGLSFEELMAAIATLTRGGLQADLAITGMKNILMEFLNPSAEAVRAAHQLGFEFNTATLHALQLSGVLEKMQQAGPELVAKLFGDMRANVAITALRQQIEGFRTDVDYIINTSGADAKALEIIIDTAAHKMGQFHAAMADLGRAVGSTLAPALGDIGQSIAMWINDQQDRIDYYATVVQIHVERIKNTFVAFASYLRDDFAGASDVAWDVFLEVMEAAGKQAVRLALKIGKGIWEGVKAGVLGESGPDMEKARAIAFERYEAGGHPVWEQALVDGLGYKTGNKERRPQNTYEFGQILTEVLAEMENERLEQFLGDATASASNLRAAKDAIKARLRQAGQTEGGSGLSTALDRIARDTERRLAEAAAKLPSPGARELEEQMEGRRLFGEAMRDKGAEAGGLTISPKFQKPKDDRTQKELEDRVRQALDSAEIHEKYAREIAMELSTVRMTNAEREKTLLIEDAKAQALRKNTALTQEQLRALEESMDRLQEVRKLKDIGDEIGYGFARGFSQATLHARRLSDVMDYLGDAAMGVLERILEIMVWEPAAQNLSAGFTSWATRPRVKTSPAPAYNAGSDVLASTLGNAFLNSRVQAFGLGGVVTGPTYFQHAGGLGVAGEVGTEGIFPLKRTPDGELGIRGTMQAAIPSVAINIQNASGAEVEATAGDVRFDGRRLLVGLHLKDRRNNGPIHRAHRRRS